MVDGGEGSGEGGGEGGQEGGGWGGRGGREELRGGEVRMIGGEGTEGTLIHSTVLLLSRPAYPSTLVVQLRGREEGQDGEGVGATGIGRRI